MDILCFECSIILSPFEMQLNEQFPIGNYFCEFCQTKKEREIIQKLAESESNMDNDWTKKTTTEDYKKGNK